VCTITDKRLTELSGLVSDGTRWYGVNDGGTQIRVYVLRRNCSVERVITAPVDPYDVEDLARGKDGTLWLADTGDNRKQRDDVALLELSTGGKVTVHRLTYPDGAHDTEALLLDRSGTPYLVTKEPFGLAGIYRPTASLTTTATVPLKRVGSVTLRSTSTSGGPVTPSIGSVLITGGAVSADGTVVALRTYTEAYLFAAPDGDVLAALGRDPVRISLPDEKQGEAIAFEPDGTLLSGSEGVGQPIRAISGASALARTSAAAATGSDPDNPAGSAGPGGVSRLGTWGALGIGGAVVLVVLVLLRRRRT
jgi:hypothetical protein